MKVSYDFVPEWTIANEKGHIRLTKDWYFTIDGRKIWIPEGYVCDGASIPRAFWSIVGSPFDPVNAIGAWAHDYLYLTHLTDKKTADEVAFQLWRKSGKGLWASRTMWFAVSKFGGSAWKNNDEDEKSLVELRTMIDIRPDKEKFDKV